MGKSKLSTDASSDERAIAARGDDRFLLAIHATGLRAILQRGREPGFAADTAPLSSSRPVEFLDLPNGTWMQIAIDRAALLSRISNADDLVLRDMPVDPSASKLVSNYMSLLLGDGELSRDLADAAGAHLLDLVALMLGASRDSVVLVRTKGLRAVRVRAVLEAINVRFREAGLSPSAVGRGLGLSGRYVQDLLCETGQTFTERVLEARLQAVRRALADPARIGNTIADVALKCGFGDMSHFNRAFKRRFGCPPGSFRQSI